MTAASSESRPPQLLGLTSRFPVLLIVSWMILYLPRPWRLGLYVDDWWTLIEPQQGTAPFSWDRLHYFVGFQTNYGPRPLMGFTTFLVTSITGTSPAAIQFACALLVLAAALSLRAWLNRFMSVIPEYRNELGDFAAVLWLSAPWMMGETAWPTVCQNMGALILLTETARLLLARERMTAGLAALVVAAVTASGLIYEAFYFWIFPIVALYALLGRGPVKGKSDCGSLLGVCVVAQALPIAFNRYAAHIHAAVTKTYSPAWPKLVVGNMLALPSTLWMGFSEYRWLALLLALGLVACCTWLWGTGRQGKPGLLRSYLFGLMGLAAVTFLITIATYSAAGYGFASLGLASRTLFAPSASVSIGFFALLCCAFLPGRRIAKTGSLVAAAALVVVLALAQERHVAEWARAWREEGRILKEAPLDEIRHLPPEAAIFYAGTSRYGNVPVFGTAYDLTAAIAARLPHTARRRPYEGLTSIFPAGRRRWSWDGATLVQSDKDGVQKFAAKHLYLWRDGAASLQPLESGFRWPPVTAESAAR